MKTLSVLLFVWGLVCSATVVAGDENPAWLVGKWQMFYDPDNAKTDYLEFMANGDLISRGPVAEVLGFYTVAPDAVKGVLTHQGRDLLLTFFFNEAKTELRIVTSNTGIETVYRKIPD